MAGIDYRQLLASDAEAVHELRFAVIQTDPHSFSTSIDQERQGSTEILASVLDNFKMASDRLVIGAFAPGLTGMVGAECQLDSDTAQVVRVWGLNVLASFRRQGIATVLVDHIIEFARTFDTVDRIVLDVMCEAVAARRFYSSMGFTELSSNGAAAPQAELKGESLAMELFLPR